MQGKRPGFPWMRGSAGSRADGGKRATEFNRMFSTTRPAPPVGRRSCRIGGDRQRGPHLFGADFLPGRIPTWRETGCVGHRKSDAVLKGGISRLLLFQVNKYLDNGRPEYC
jgi:hypothetical protein